MLLSTADVAWLNWEPEIQAAPGPKRLSILNPNLEELIVFDPLAVTGSSFWKLYKPHMVPRQHLVYNTSIASR